MRPESELAIEVLLRSPPTERGEAVARLIESLQRDASNGQRHAAKPLVGTVRRYDRPFDPVAEEWEADQS